MILVRNCNVQTRLLNLAKLGKGEGSVPQIKLDGQEVGWGTPAKLLEPYQAHLVERRQAVSTAL